MNASQPYSKVQAQQRARLIVILVVTLTLLLMSCTSRPEIDIIDLSDLQDLNITQSGEIVPLKLAVANVISPTGTLESYSAIVEYISEKLGRPVELVQRRTYAETNDLVRQGEVDIAFVCTSAYVIGHEEFGMELLVAPQVNQETVYYSYLIVPSDSEANSMKDLQGLTFAFTDPLSNSGRLYPTFLVHQLGENPESFFGRTFFTYSHDDAIQAVATGLADGAAIDSLVYQFTISRHPGLADQVRVIHKSPPFGIPPVVIGPQVRPQFRVELQELFLGMNDDPLATKALSELDIEKFVLIGDTAYDSVRELLSIEEEIAFDLP
jgi:phosphonate transport system substrate-binding protein